MRNIIAPIFTTALTMFATTGVSIPLEVAAQQTQQEQYQQPRDLGVNEPSTGEARYRDTGPQEGPSSPGRVQPRPPVPTGPWHPGFPDGQSSSGQGSGLEAEQYLQEIEPYLGAE